MRLEARNYFLLTFQIFLKIFRSRQTFVFNKISYDINIIHTCYIHITLYTYIIMTTLCKMINVTTQYFRIIKLISSKYYNMM